MSKGILLPNIMNNPKFKVGDMSGFQSIKIFLLKDILLIEVKKFLL